MLKRSTIFLAWILTLMAIAIPVSAATPVVGGTLRIAVSSLQNLQLYKTAQNDITDAQSCIFDALFALGKDNFKPIPALAESWSNPDPLTWVFKIRKGVKFHDDNPVFPKGKSREVTADDVVFSINFMMKTTTAWTLGPVTSVKALDRYTVEVKTQTPQPFLINDPNRLCRVAIIPKEAIDQLGEDGFAKYPIGTGPFKFKSFSPDSGLLLVKNSSYFLPIYLDAVEFVVIPDPISQSIALQSGEVDIIKYLFNLEMADSFEKNANFNVIRSAGGSYRGLGFNVTVEPFNKQQVRKGFSMLLDIDTAYKAVIGSHGERAYCQVPPWVPFGYDPSLKSLWTYNPSEGLKLLTANGFGGTDSNGFLEYNGKPFKIEIKTLAGSQTKTLTILATQLREKGINASVLTEDTAVWADDLVKGNSGMFFDYSFAGTTGLHSLFHSSMIGRSNTHYYKNSDVDAILDKALATTDFNELSALWKKAQKQIFQDVAGIPLYFEYAYSIVNKKIMDFVPPWGGLHLVSTENSVWINK
ncbi:MAG: ABC transporter substrate-binding protein [Rectinema sp.]